MPMAWVLGADVARGLQVADVHLRTDQACQHTVLWRRTFSAGKGQVIHSNGGFLKPFRFTACNTGLFRC